MASPAQPLGGYAAAAASQPRFSDAELLAAVPCSHVGKGRGSQPQPQTQNLEQLFNEAFETVLSRWTILNLAVEQGWGGRETRQKVQLLKEELVQVLAAGGRKRRPPCHTNVDDVQDLCDLIYERLFSYFHVECDDESDKEVASVSLRLFNTCRVGDPSYAREVIQLCKGVSVDLSKCQGKDMTQYETPEDELLDKMNGMDLDDMRGDDFDDCSGDSDMDDDGEKADAGAPMQEPAAAVPEKQAPPEPVVDEDGFTSVAKGRRRPKAN